MLAPPMIRAVEWRPLAQCADISDAWRALAARAVEPNVFYEPAFALTAAPAFGPDVGALLAWAQDGRLAGLFPLRRRRLLLPMLTGWTHPFAPLGTPLIDRDALAPTLDAVLDHVAADPRLPKLLALPLMRADGPLAAALDVALAARGGRTRLFDAHERPLLKPGANAGELLAQQRKKLERKRGKFGNLSYEIDGSPDGVARALAEFLALETRGWKGRAGTATTQHADIERFVTGAVMGLAAEGKVLGARLDHDGAAIAAVLVLRSGDGAWGWKVAYDEGFSRASPGVRLVLEVSERLLAEDGLAFADSCAAPGQPTFGSIWGERLAVADRLIAVTTSAPFALACGIETMRRRLIATARAARDHVRTLRATR